MSADLATLYRGLHKIYAGFLSRWASHCDVDLSSCRQLSKEVMEFFVGPSIVRNYYVSNGSRDVTYNEKLGILIAVQKILLLCSCRTVALTSCLKAVRENTCLCSVFLEFYAILDYCQAASFRPLGWCATRSPLIRRCPWLHCGLGALFRSWRTPIAPRVLGLS